MVAGKVELDVREALLGYLLRQWNVDCSSDASLVGGEYHLWFSNVDEFAQIESLAIARGYKESNV